MNYATHAALRVPQDATWQKDTRLNSLDLKAASTDRREGHIWISFFGPESGAPLCYRYLFPPAAGSSRQLLEIVAIELKNGQYGLP